MSNIFQERLSKLLIEEYEAKNVLYDHLIELKHQQKIIEDLVESIEDNKKEQEVIVKYLEEDNK